MKKILTDIRWLLLITVILFVVFVSMLKLASRGTVIEKNMEIEVQSVEEAESISGLNMPSIDCLGNILTIKAYKGTEHITFDRAELIVRYTDGERLNYFENVNEEEVKIEDTNRFKNITYKTSKSTINGKDEVVKLINFNDEENGYVLILVGELNEKEIINTIVGMEK